MTLLYSKLRRLRARVARRRKQPAKSGRRVSAASDGHSAPGLKAPQGATPPIPSYGNIELNLYYFKGLIGVFRPKIAVDTMPTER